MSSCVLVICCCCAVGEVTTGRAEDFLFFVFHFLVERIGCSHNFFASFSSLPCAGLVPSLFVVRDRHGAHLPWKRMCHGMHEAIVQWRIKHLSC